MIYDALIIGGGPAGATCAILLARAGWSVALLEKTAFPRRKVCGEFISAPTLPLLHHLGIGEWFQDKAGPLVRVVGVFAYKHMLSSPMPTAAREAPWGRALGREQLDTMLLDIAKRSGADIHQPAKAKSLHRDGDVWVCESTQSQENFTVSNHTATQSIHLTARTAIAAHGSWESGDLPTQLHSPLKAKNDLLAFKAHFRDADLPSDLMALLAFPGGYGGLVHSDGDRLSFSCCIQRETMTRLRAQAPHQRAGDAVLQHVFEHCLGARQALSNAKCENGWLASGPIRPGIRLSARDGIWRVGNCAGEAHPIVAEGISMAMQGAELLAQRLIAHRKTSGAHSPQAMQGDYAHAWRRQFATRMRYAALFAGIAVNPPASAAIVPLFRRWPRLTTWGAAASGKSRAPSAATR